MLKTENVFEDRSHSQCRVSPVHQDTHTDHEFGFPEKSASVNIPPPPSYDQIKPSFPNASAPPYGHYHKGLHKVELDNTFTLPEVVRKRKDDPVTL